MDATRYSNGHLAVFCAIIFVGFLAAIVWLLNDINRDNRI